MALVLVEVAAGVATLTLNDPSARNTMSAAMVDEIVAAVDQLEADADVCAIVVTGTPPAFCAGAHLDHLASATEASLRAVYEGFLRIARTTLPTIAAVNGAAVGAGMNLALACDVRLAGESARFDARFAQIGLHPGGGHTWMLSRLAGPQATSAAALFGEVFGGREAERLGIALRCVPDGELLAAAHEMAARAGGGPRELLVEVKRTIRQVGEMTAHDDAVQLEAGRQLWSTTQPWFASRLASTRLRTATPAERLRRVGDSST